MEIEARLSESGRGDSATARCLRFGERASAVMDAAVAVHEMKDCCRVSVLRMTMVWPTG
jgi:hypothetical protein